MRPSTSPTRHPAPDPRLRELREALGQVTSRDFGRLSGRWRALSRKPDAAKIDALGKDIATSVARRATLAGADRGKKVVWGVWRCSWERQ